MREGPYRVFACAVPADEGLIEVATVKTLDECVTALADYYERTPAQWVRKRAGWSEKETCYSHLSVEQDQRGRWRAYRDEFSLLNGRGEPANFSTLDEAQRVADIHLLDNYPNAQPAVDDGYWWLVDPEMDWRLLPEEVALRAQWKPLASLWRPDVKQPSADRGSSGGSRPS
ncbi:hypothetical protein CQ12_33465 [Bradyrhizobium jicamae]|uniref:Uncharacterized protein n=1 Tax=Bradyrhizobium jicamae TaxID=280332 RepID=A0A0R3LKM2_9BRAD|nr:hypothetical protein CQ12_33465 [Bradyrhizobium jicamae]